MRHIYRERLCAQENHDEKRSPELYVELLERSESVFFEYLENVT